MRLDEQQLIRELRNGSPDAYQALLDTHGPPLLRLATTLLGNQTDGEDAVQQTLVNMFNAIGRFRGESTLKTWLTRILINQVSKMRRQRATRMTLSLEVDGAVPPTAPGDAVASASAKADLAEMLSALSPEHRDILVLRELEGLSYKEIAAALGVPQGTVESRLFRAREQLRQRFAGYVP